MSRVRVAVTIKVPPAELWRLLEDIDGHTHWMADAETIRFTSERRTGVGTTFDCYTRVGPLALMDRMEVTEWQPGRSMGVRHRGLVKGSGVFRLRARGLRHRRTRLVWRERLRFPWWMGGRIGALLAKPVFHLIWRANLRRLKELAETGEIL